ncbi:MlaE family ABC transporter permease [Pendulispora albinea]|uniref:ABC transporter permease n=1 Tax=Pendulispora albinea TaxID=2741071 RepID=A0ABZ2M9S0_9BACT
MAAATAPARNPNPRGPSRGTGTSKLDSFAGNVGKSFLYIAATAGGMGVLLGQIIARLFPPRIDKTELWRNLYKMSVKSLPIVAVTALFTGAIMVIQAAPIVKRYGAEGLLGWGAGFGTLREIAPLLTALMISGRVGANNTAELGTMVVTEQVDALRTLAIDPISFLILPRFIGITLTLFMMTLYADILALFGAAFTGEALLTVSPQSFYNGLVGGLLGFGDVANGLCKSFVFGLVIALSSCHFGLSTTGGAPGVGRSVTATVVASAAGVFIIDYLVSFILG